MSNPRRFFDGMVVPSYRAWLEDPLAEWLAKCAVGYADDLAERIFCYWEKGDLSQIAGAARPGEYRTYLRTHVCEDFGLVWDVHDGHKHMTLNRKNRLVTRADQTGVLQIGYGEAYGEAYGGAEMMVITLDDGSKKSLLIVMQSVMGMWQEVLVKMEL